MRWEIGNTLLRVLCLCAAGWACVATGFAVTHSDGNRPDIWAAYYVWYETPESHGSWRHWSQDGPQCKNPAPSSKAKPLIGYYHSEDTEVARWHIQLAKASGIDAFLVSWWGSGSLSGKAFDRVILPAAAEADFKVGILCELAQFHQDVQILANGLQTFLKRAMTNSAYLRVEGKPVVYLYQVPFAPKLTLQTFEQLRRQVESGVGPVYWLMDKVTNVDNRGINFPEEWLRIPEIHMIGFYGTFSIHRQYKYADLAPAYARVARQAHEAGKKVFLPAHPGHDNSGFRPDDHFVMPRENGDTLKGYLRAAAEAKVDVVLLTSFNEWPETTIVEPSSTWADPYQYLKIIAQWKGMQFVPPRNRADRTLAR